MLIWMHAFALLMWAFNILYAVRKKTPLAKNSALLAAAVSGKHMWTHTYVLR